MKLGFRGKIYFVFFALLLIQGLVIFFWTTHVLKDAIISSIFVAGIVGTLLLIPVTNSIKRLHDSPEKILKGNPDVRAFPKFKKNGRDLYQENLSDLKSAERFLDEQKTLLQTILDAIPDFISLQDNKGRYVSVNRAFCEILNKTKKEIVGKTNADLFQKAHAQKYSIEDRTVLETKIPLVKENRVKSLNGSKWLHVVKIPVLETKKKVTGLVCSGRDITEFKRVQEQLTHAQKMESVGRLAAGVAHEINTPLGIILGYAQLLLEDVEKDGQVYEDVATIAKQTKNCSKIVADLLNFSRSSQKDITTFNIIEAMEEILHMVEHTFSMNHVIVKHEYDKDPLLMIGDKEKLKQVFINLLNNAFDSIKENGSIIVNTNPGETLDEIKISISDTGCGISKDNIKKIFEPFYTTKGPDQGTGLGLSVTFGIIKEHKGTIKAYSPPLTGNKKNRGTQFIIELPTGLNMKKGELNGKHSRTG
ncbi:MAG: PAS domain S-box protein [Desulfobacula sp.]|jgi:two-component system, NtrC family, sensor kinase|nr:PAS domain S-box protein [Desulfobacula sp.]